MCIHYTQIASKHTNGVSWSNASTNRNSLAGRGCFRRLWDPPENRDRKSHAFSTWRRLLRALITAARYLRLLTRCGYSCGKCNGRFGIFVGRSVLTDFWWIIFSFHYTFCSSCTHTLFKTKTRKILANHPRRG